MVPTEPAAAGLATRQVIRPVQMAGGWRAAHVVVDCRAEDLPRGARMLVVGLVAALRVPLEPLLETLGLLVPRGVVRVFIVCQQRA